MMPNAIAVVTEPVEKARLVSADGTRAQGQDRKQRRQKCHDVDKGAQHAKHHHIAQDVKRRRIRVRNPPAAVTDVRKTGQTLFNGADIIRHSAALSYFHGLHPKG